MHETFQQSPCTCWSVLFVGNLCFSPMSSISKHSCQLAFLTSSLERGTIPYPSPEQPPGRVSLSGCWEEEVSLKHSFLGTQLGALTAEKEGRRARQQVFKKIHMHKHVYIFVFVCAGIAVVELCTSPASQKLWSAELLPWAKRKVELAEIFHFRPRLVFLSLKASEVCLQFLFPHHLFFTMSYKEKVLLQGTEALLGVEERVKRTGVWEGSCKGVEGRAEWRRANRILQQKKKLIIFVSSNWRVLCHVWEERRIAGSR